MLGWKTAERTITTEVLLDQAVDLLTESGFESRERNTGHAILQRGTHGTWTTVSIEKAPIDLAIAESEDGLFLQLRYNTFVLFDTGDLDELADELVEVITRRG